MAQLGSCWDSVGGTPMERTLMGTEYRYRAIAVIIAAFVMAAVAFGCTREIHIESTRIVESTREVPVEVPVEVTRIVEVEATRQVPVEVTRLIEVAATREVPYEVPVEVTREVPVTREVDVEVTREIQVTREATVEVTREVPIEVTRRVPVEVTREVTVEVTREVTVEVTRLVVAATTTPAPSATPDAGESIDAEVSVGQGREIDFGRICGDGRSSVRKDVRPGTYRVAISGSNIGSGDRLFVELRNIDTRETIDAWTLRRNDYRKSSVVTIGGSTINPHEFQVRTHASTGCVSVVLSSS